MGLMSHFGRGSLPETWGPVDFVYMLSSYTTVQDKISKLALFITRLPAAVPLTVSSLDKKLFGGCNLEDFISKLPLQTVKTQLALVIQWTSKVQNIC